MKGVNQLSMRIYFNAQITLSNAGANSMARRIGRAMSRMASPCNVNIS
jgi:hypothetical protein